MKNVTIDEVMAKVDVTLKVLKDYHNSMPISHRKSKVNKKLAYDKMIGAMQKANGLDPLDQESLKYATEIAYWATNFITLKMQI